MARNYSLKVEVTQNGNGFDNPITGSVQKRGNAPSTANLTFPNLNGKFKDYFASNDVIRVYVGLDAIEPEPIITGFPVDDTGRSMFSIRLSDMLTRLNHSQAKIDDFNNYDGVEAARAMQALVDDVDMSMYSSSIDTSGICGTNPRVILAEDFRHKDYSTVWKMLQDINSRCWDTTEFPKTPLSYSFWMSDTKMNFRKKQRADEASAVYSFDTIDDILTSKPTRSLVPVINKCTVIGATYKDPATGIQKNYEGTYTHQSSVDAQGEHHAIIKDQTLTNNWECEQKAARYVFSSKVRRVTSTIDVPNLMSGIPNITVISVDDSDYGIEGNHIVSELDISFGGGNTGCSVTLNNVEPVMTDYV